jgi:hypothetical protein
VRVALYKAPGTWFDKVVRWWTRSQYSHCELVFSNGLWFSSSPRDGGCRFKSITPADGAWDFIEISLTPEQERAVYDFCLREDGCWYDWIGIIFTQVLPLSFENPWWWFCSEICVAALQRAGLLAGVTAFHVDPGQLAQL